MGLVRSYVHVHSLLHNKHSVLWKLQRQRQLCCFELQHNCSFGWVWIVFGDKQRCYIFQCTGANVSIAWLVIKILVLIVVITVHSTAAGVSLYVKDATRGTSS